MKKIVSIIPIVGIIIITVLCILFLDLNQSRNFLQFNSYKTKFFRIDYSENVKINNLMIKKILLLAKENSVIIQKTNYSNVESNVRNVYFSFDHSQDLYNFISENHDTKKINSLFNNNSYISTYAHNDKNQIGLIADLLGNSKYNYYIFDKLLSTNENLYGEYVIYYKNYNKLNKFLLETSKILEKDITSEGKFNNSQIYIIYLMVISITILMLFYGIFQIFEVYYKSKQIGCMRLLGYSEIKISKLMIKRNIKIYLFVISVIMLFLLLLVKNLTFLNFIFIFFIDLSIILLTFLINFLCVRIIYMKAKISDIIKKNNITAKISNVSIKLKLVVIVILLVLITIFFKVLQPLYLELNVYKNSKELLNYGIISNFNGDAREIYDYEKHSILYKNIVNNPKLKTFYANFDQYYLIGDEEREATLHEGKGSFIRYGSVDKNYLKKENLIVYDLNGNEMKLDDLSGMFFLFPKSKETQINSFEKIYKKRSITTYEKYNINYNFRVFFYDDKQLNTYRLDLKIKNINSPILRVIDENFKVSYIESSLGIDVFGTSLTTGLKIEIEKSRKETFEILAKDIEKSGLENLIGIDNFMSFSEYFSTQINLSKNIIFFVSLSILIIFLVYLMISIQVILLYAKSENRKVLVKYILGYDRTRIYFKIIRKCIIYDFIAFFLAAVILFFIGYLNILFYFIAMLLLLIFDVLVLFTIVKFSDFSNVYIGLKGGSYD